MTNGSTTMTTNGNLKSTKSPSKASIDLIRQFARTCITLNDMRLGVMVAN